MAAVALFQHYIEYIFTPSVALGLLIVVGPILLSIVAEKVAAASTKPTAIEGCRRLGLRDPSNLQNQYDPLLSKDKGPPRVRALFTYPIKSCRGVELLASRVQASGLEYDRLFTFAQLTTKPDKADSKDPTAEPSGEWKHQWRFITQREFPRLALLQTELWVPKPRGRRQGTHTKAANGRPESKLGTPTAHQRPRSRTRGNTLLSQLEHQGSGSNASSSPEISSWADNGGCLIVRFPFEPDFNPFGLRTEMVELHLPLSPTPQRAEARRYESEELSIWKDFPLAINVTNEIDAEALSRLKYFLGVSNPLALFRVDDTHKRAVTRCLPKDKLEGESYTVGFADAFPVNILGLPSVRKTDEELPKAASVKGKLDALRFRANIFISGTSAFDEDTWTKITLGSRIGRDKEGLFETDAEYHVACRTARCKLPNVDPDTGVKDRNEPYTTLGKTRKIDEGAYPSPCLGMQIIPRFQVGAIKVGDRVDVLETGEHCYEKMFH
ncbi:hypothetical protein LTR36_004566 [Oleoguttula mirabilis]|uniref:MOSC domain-containing protein n=1 Tax=Oleoguttula mirabilis TaxID=1507867 RepID=A0AAV9JGM5_9PEZI|nr:hypothetical protein LTR36_004566 [Oleoguttula mirabilis]